MANNLLVTYDLKKQGQNYEALILAIKSFSHWAHIQGSVWYVKSDFNAKQVKDFLIDYIDNNDILFVAEMENAAWSLTLNNAVSQYLADHWNR